jgi:hypothetical protein
MESGAWPVWPNGAPRWPLSDAATPEARPLDDVMLAMDVVDTLRHSRRLVEKELASEEDDARLLRRLRDTYASQGIEVPDEILRQGVAALKEKRFVYTPPPFGLWTFLARLYVTRKRWRADLFVYAILIALAWQWDSFGISTRVRSLVEWPAIESTEVAEVEPLVETKEGAKTKKVAGAKQAVLDNLTALLQSIEALVPKETVLARARGIFERGTGAIGAGNLVKAHEAADDLTELHDLLALTFEMRIVSRPNQPSGVWRVPDANPEARNYYLIVEAVDGSGNRLPVELTSEEDGQTREVIMWGVRVSEETFEKIKADKLDDGILQTNTLAIKRVGRLEADYLIPVIGGVITEW